MTHSRTSRAQPCWDPGPVGCYARATAELPPIHPTHERSFAMNDRASLMNTVAPSPPLSPTEATLFELTVLQDTTHDLLSTLRNRLGLVLVPNPTGGTATDAPPEPVRSPLCDALVARTRSERGLHHRISEILDSLSI